LGICGLIEQFCWWWCLHCPAIPAFVKAGQDAHRAMVYVASTMMITWFNFSNAAGTNTWRFRFF
jgi:hypothetical protein